MSLDADGHDEVASHFAAVMATASATRARTAALQRRTEQVVAEARAVERSTTDAWRLRRSSPAGRELLRRSEYMRLRARLDSMPVIEQAKGIIMAQSRCTEADAFDMLRRASQRSNIPVRDLAARIVAKASRTTPPAPDSIRRDRGSRRAEPPSVLR